MTKPVNSSEGILDGYTFRPLNPESIGAPSKPITSVEQLADQLKISQFKSDCVLVIYGDNLKIIKDPGILAINPMKLILVGIQIDQSDEDDSLEQLMMKSDWNYDLYGGLEVKEGSSVTAALMNTLEKDSFTQKPLRMVYSIET